MYELYVDETEINYETETYFKKYFIRTRFAGLARRNA